MGDPAASTAATTADRVAKHVAERNEIGDIPPVRHPRLRERCRLDLALFGRYYCRSILNHPPSALIVEQLVTKMQAALINGGQLAVEFSRGAGKTTWTIIALAWAILYGHRRFLVAVAASRPLSKTIRNAVCDLLTNSDPILADFPAVPTALRAMRGVVQKGMVLTYRSRPIQFESSDLLIRFPNLRDDSGKPLDAACGAILACRGAGASVRGLNVSGQRPDFILFDDPQTRKDAASPSAIQRLDDYIHADALNLSANTSTLAAFLTITPQRLGDLAMRIADRSLHPNWSLSRCPFLIKTPPDFDANLDGFLSAYARDVAADDFTRSASRQWYLANRALFNGAETLDPLAYDPATEVDSIHHALCKIAAVGKTVFNSEYQMEVAPGDALVSIDPTIVANAVNTMPKWHMPPGCDKVVVACDVNIDPGITYVALALGGRNTTAIIGYGRYPERGTLCPPNSPVAFQQRAVAAAIAALVQRFDRMAIPSAADPRRRFRVRAIGFDRGWFPAVVCKTLARLRRSTTAVLDPIRGAGNNYRPPPNAAYGDHMFYGQSREDQVQNRSLGDYLTIHSNYWEEIAQAAFLETPLLPGSCSLYGSDPSAHAEFAAEICNKRLTDKTLDNGRLQWHFATLGPEHYLDAYKMALALASWHHCYIAAETIRAPAAANDAPLFDPRQNPSLFAPVSALPSVSPAAPAAAHQSIAKPPNTHPRNTHPPQHPTRNPYPPWHKRRRR